ncbi:MAG: L(+)-tartrate dehydratase subunit alpha [Syntrophomonadaceae bacterium]|nr:L(+)-tartrate dehydratase subunit alpha [Bacillota bacterium]
MREIKVAEISKAVFMLFLDANYDLGEDVLASLQAALQVEPSPTGRNVLEQLIVNAEIARDEQVPMCQDTGYAVVFAELGQDVRVVGGDFYAAVNEGVRQAYIDGFLRKSIVADPLNRVNTGDNTPAVIHVEIVPGDKIRLIVAPKGGGSENMSAVRMLKPADGAKGVMDFVVDTVSRAGSNPCPPVVVGVGIGGTMEKVALIAKKALLRKLGEPHPDSFYAGMERDLLEKINKLGIGPQGYGGRTTALAVHIETYPAHIASLPAAVNINCHASRHKERVL